MPGHILDIQWVCRLGTTCVWNAFAGRAFLYLEDNWGWVKLLAIVVKTQTSCILPPWLHCYQRLQGSVLCHGAVPEVLFALAGVGRAAELGQPRPGHRRRAQRPPPPRTRAAPRQPGGAEPHAPHAPGRACAGPAAVPEAQGNVSSCLMSALLSQNSPLLPSFPPFDASRVWETIECRNGLHFLLKPCCFTYRYKKKLDSPGKDLWQEGKGKMYCLEYLDEWVKLPKHLVLFWTHAYVGGCVGVFWE